MKFIETALDGAYIVTQDSFGDDRGFFARAYCKDELAAVGATYEFVQANISGNTHAGTLRGLHYQDATALEAKFLRCVSGAIYDVVVDLRPGSATYLKWIGVELTEENRKAILVPPLFAHGYLTLTENAQVFYQTSHPYAPGAERGARYDDPALNIEWPASVKHISDKDANWDTLEQQGLLANPQAEN